MSINFNYSNNSPNLLQQASNLVTSAANQFIVRPLGAPNLTGISGYIFDILDDEEISLDSEITDNYVESNYAIQDHIALKPVKFTLRGYVSELLDSTPNALAAIYTRLKGLQTLGGLAPDFNVQDSQFYTKVNDTVQKVTNVFNQAKSVFQLFNVASTSTNKQQKVYQYFYGLWSTRQLCSVETPFGLFENMAIESVRALQSGDTRFISDFSVTFKQIQVVQSITVSNAVGSLISQNWGSIVNAPKLAGGVFQQTVSAVSKLGTDAGTAVNKAGVTFTVANVSQARFIQQLGL